MAPKPADDSPRLTTVVPAPTLATLTPTHWKAFWPAQQGSAICGV